ncbi:MAG: hypothetical protein LBE83_09580 [Propionibacteriaceae bacterium]|jgi:uncharacterized Zn finger protein (UPF0148 family)|nr:hypothetical protein [Propionibacteriaceae bacterium]
MGSRTTGFLARLTTQAYSEKTYGSEAVHEGTSWGAVSVTTCPGCGAGRARSDGLTHCGYCGHQFLDRRFTDGINLSSSDNSN